MKKILTGICILSMVALSNIQAQNKNEIWKNDPTYSSNNYKHPNKAATAKNVKQSGEVLIQVGDGHSNPKATMPARRILVTEKTKSGKVKTPLAIRRKASEKLPDFVLDSEANQQQMDD